LLLLPALLLLLFRYSFPIVAIPIVIVPIVAIPIIIVITVVLIPIVIYIPTADVNVRDAA
jgi:hypothetical protein